jgi:hypothetical protein
MTMALANLNTSLSFDRTRQLTFWSLEVEVEEVTALMRVVVVVAAV